MGVIRVQLEQAVQELRVLKIISAEQPMRLLSGGTMSAVAAVGRTFGVVACVFKRGAARGTHVFGGEIVS